MSSSTRPVLPRKPSWRRSEPSWVAERPGPEIGLGIVGPVGVGETFLASALGHLACRHGYRVGEKVAP